MMSPDLPKRLTHDLFPAIAGAFLVGLAAGRALPNEEWVVPLFSATTGALLLAAFRVYEGRAVEQEERIAVLEDHRRALGAANDRLERLHDSIMEAAASGLGMMPGADDHRSGVAPIAVAVGREMGLDADAVAGLRTAALVHDIGRLDVPAEVWSKPGPLTETEWKQVRSHPESGARRLEQIEFPWPVAAIVRGQQEHWDGTGFPDGLFGESIPIGARILAVADAYHAMRSERPHRPAMDHRETMQALARAAGRRFDPRVVAAFSRLVTRGDFLDLVPPQKHENPTTIRLSGCGADERI